MTGLHICRSVRGFLFDLDGTLIDSCQIIISSLQKSLRVAAGMEASWETLRNLIGQPLDRMLEQLGVAEPDVVADHYRRHYPFGAQSEIFGGVPRLLDELVRRNYDLALVTTRPEGEAVGELRAHRIASYFPVVVTGTQVRRRKPDPEPVMSALHMLGREPDEAIMVGDSAADIEAGERAGAWTALAAWGDLASPRDVVRADFVWHHPRDIISALDDRGQSFR